MTSPPLVIALHGFGLGPGAFVDVAAALPFELRAPELAGHGDSAAQAFDDVVANVAELVLAQPSRPILWGYSLGARIALAVALRTTQTTQATQAMLAGLVLESGSAGIADEQERATRRALDESRARALESGGVEAFFRTWDAQPLFASMSARDDVSARRRALRARHDAKRLADALRAFSPGARRPLHAELQQIAVPTLLIAGADDGRFVAEARALQAIPSSTLALLSGCGHAPHLEDPLAVAAALTAFIQERTT